MSRQNRKIDLIIQKPDIKDDRTINAFFPEAQAGCLINFRMEQNKPVIDIYRLDPQIIVMCPALTAAEREIERLTQQVADLQAQLDADKPLGEDDLWSVARIEVIGSKNGWANLDPKDAAFYSTRKARANDDDRYPGILECQFDNYDSGIFSVPQQSAS